MLKKSNYYCDKVGETLKTAYAVAQVNTDNSTITFYIASSRQKALNKQAVEVVKMRCACRTNNPLETAYIYAKGQDKELVFNEENNKYEEVVTNRYFYDWEDDILEK